MKQLEAPLTIVLGIAFIIYIGINNYNCEKSNQSPISSSENKVNQSSVNIENSNENLQAISGIDHPIPCSDKKDDEMILIKAPLENSFGEDSLDNDGNIVYREWYETLEEHSHNEDYYHEHPDSENNDNE